MASLTDITIYDTFAPVILPDDKRKLFIREKNFICELYHDNLCNYKPPKTSRICLNISNEEVPVTPSYFGSICHSFHYFDREKYLELDKLDRYEFLLSYIHNSILKISIKLNWDKIVFSNAYSAVRANNFKYLKEFPAKLSPDRRKKGLTILEKTEEVSKWSIRIFGKDIDITTLLIQKTNNYPLDVSIELAKKSRWIDNNKFGYKDIKSEKTIHYDCSSGKRVRNIKFFEEDYENIYATD